MQSRGRGSSSSPWGLVLAVGIVAVLFGLIIVVNPFDSLRAITALVGVFLLIAGIVGVVAGRSRGAAGAAGPVVAIIGGIVLLVLPGVTLKVLAVVVGLILLTWGLVTVLAAWRERASGGSMAGGIALSVLGLVVVVWPGPTLALISLLVGIAVLLFGIGMVVQALRMRS